MQDIRDAPMRSRPSNRIWIRDILESNLIKDTNEIETRYGLIYRTHIMGTIVDLEFFSKKDGEDGIFDVDHEDGQEKTQNMNAVIDDGTGRIKVMAWSVSPAWQSALNEDNLCNNRSYGEYDDFITKTRQKQY